MDATFLGLLNSQINFLQQSETDAEGNFIIMETVKLLMDNLNLSDDTLSSYDKFGIRRLFASIGEVGKDVCTFFDEQKNILDPQALNGSIGKTLENTAGQIESTTKALKELGEKEAELLSREEELQKLREEYKQLSDKTVTLKEIAKKVSDSVIQSIGEENRKLEEDIKSGEKKKAVVEAENIRLKEVYEGIASVLSEYVTTAERLETQITEAIEKHRSELERIYATREKSIEEIKTEIETYVKDFNALDNSVREYVETKRFYELWLGDNSLIIANMRKYGLESIAQLSAVIEDVKSNVETELAAYDALIKKIIEDEEAARKEIEKKQNKTV
jgi:chromosome segregation ATPase